MDDKQRMAEMEALLRGMMAATGPLYPTEDSEWVKRARAILAPPPDPDAGGEEVIRIHNEGSGGYWLLSDYSERGKKGWRAVAAWHEAGVKAARIAALRRAMDVCQPGGTSAERIADLIAKAEAPDA